MSKKSYCMKCGERVQGADSVYIVASGRVPSGAKCGFTNHKVASATLCHRCGKKFRFELTDWLGRK